MKSGFGSIVLLLVISGAANPLDAATRATTTTYCQQADVATGTCPVVSLVTSVKGTRTEIEDATTCTCYSRYELEGKGK